MFSYEWYSPRRSWNLWEIYGSSSLLLLSCSFEKWLLVQSFFTYSTRSTCIALLSSFAVLVRRYFLGRGQLFLGAIFMWCNIRWCKVSGGQLCWGAIIREAIFLGRNCPRSFTSRTILYCCCRNKWLLLIKFKSYSFVVWFVMMFKNIKMF